MWIRDKFTEYGLIDWEDDTYVVATRDDKADGQACKWGASEKLLEILPEYTTATAQPSYKREEGILVWSNPIEVIRKELINKVFLGKVDIIKPIRIFKIPFRWEDHLEKVNQIVKKTMERLELAA
jgi:hypothetical protein